MATTYKITFDRIGRNHGVEPQMYEIGERGDGDALAEGIYYFARRFLVSNDFEIAADVEAGKGSIEAGRFGTFTIEEVPSV